jgi:thiosulfate/3-mercaptopyruvate sulfurtransferase
MSAISDRGYLHSEVLVSTDWLSSNLDNDAIRIIESNEDQLLYSSGHIPGAIEIDWVRDLNQDLRRDYLNKDSFEKLMSRSGIDNSKTVVFYGDKNNWWACYAFWVFQLFGHTNAKVMDGGRLKWTKEGKPTTKAIPRYPEAKYQAPERDDTKDRVFRDDVLIHLQKNGPLVDVRSPQEYTGEKLHMDGYPNEGALRGGHIPGARNIPWARAINADDGTFKTANELRKIYESEAQLSDNDDIIAYCRIGERSSHSWFVLKYLLGYKKVRNYDGSWTEWGNLVNVPIEK